MVPPGLLSTRTGPLAPSGKPCWIALGQCKAYTNTAKLHNDMIDL
jgi:hypothetical protein